MEYKISCPSCGAKLSRWHWMLSTMRYRCRGCGAYFRMTAMGWLITLAVIVAEIFWYVLFRAGTISAYVGIGLVLATCILATFGLPYVTPVRGAEKTEKQNP